MSSTNCIFCVYLIVGIISTFAGSTIEQSGYADGTGSNALFSNMQGIAVGANNNFFVADSCSLRKITTSGESRAS